jgi:hypothetical protein
LKQTTEALRVTAWRAQRLDNDRRWPNPVVVKLDNVVPGLDPPVVVTTAAQWDPNGRTAILTARLETLGDARSVRVGFEYRRKKGPAEDVTEPVSPGHSRNGRHIQKRDSRGTAPTARTLAPVTSPWMAVLLEAAIVIPTHHHPQEGSHACL